MPMTLNQIVEEADRLPPKQVSELVDRLTLSLHHAMDPEIEDAWLREVQKRVAQIESGEERGVSAEEMKTRVQNALGR